MVPAAGTSYSTSNAGRSHLMPNGAPMTEYRASFDATIKFIPVRAFARLPG